MKKNKPRARDVKRPMFASRAPLAAALSACVGCRWPALAFVGCRERWLSSAFWIWPGVLSPPCSITAALPAFVGICWPALAVVANVGLHLLLLAIVSCHGPLLACIGTPVGRYLVFVVELKKRIKKTYLGLETFCVSSPPPCCCFASLCWHSWAVIGQRSWAVVSLHWLSSAFWVWPGSGSLVGNKM